MARKKASEVGTLAGILVLIAVAAVIAVLFNSYTQPEFGGQMAEFSEGLQTGAVNFPYVGNMDTQVYYRSSDPRVKQIPLDKRVYFKSEKIARVDYEYTPAPGTT
ncbi:MAG: hypothetical protein HRF49_11620 [bacterium]|jgi:hypothetical protein